MYLYLMDHVLQKFINIEWISNGLSNLFSKVLDNYQNQSTNPDIRTQLFYDNIELNDSYTDIDQEFTTLPDVDELIESSEQDLEKEHDYYR